MLILSCVFYCRTYNHKHVGVITLIGWKNDLDISPEDDEVLVSEIEW